MTLEPIFKCKIFLIKCVKKETSRMRGITFEALQVIAPVPKTKKADGENGGNDAMVNLSWRR